MRLAPGTPLSVALAFEPDSAPLPAGRLAIEGGLAQLEWSREVIARRLAVSPLYYPPKSTLMAARTRSFEGLSAQGEAASSRPRQQPVGEIDNRGGDEGGIGHDREVMAVQSPHRPPPGESLSGLAIVG